MFSFLRPQFSPIDVSLHPHTPSIPTPLTIPHGLIPTPDSATSGGGCFGQPLHRNLRVGDCHARTPRHTVYSTTRPLPLFCTNIFDQTTILNTDNTNSIVLRVYSTHPESQRATHRQTDDIDIADTRAHHRHLPHRYTHDIPLIRARAALVCCFD